MFGERLENVQDRISETVVKRLKEYLVKDESSKKKELSTEYSSGDETDEYSSGDEIDSFDDVGLTRIQVTGAGIDEVNGIYNENGEVDSVKKFTKNGEWNGQQCVFSMFRCRVEWSTVRFFNVSLSIG